MAGSEYRIKMTSLAERDLDSIYAYIAYELVADQAANNVVDRIENAIRNLKQFPLSSGLVDEPVLREKGYRRLVVGNYVVFYVVDESKKEVTIMRILYGRQKYQGLL